MERAPGVERASAQRRSAGELIKQLSEQVPALVCDELKPAQLEMTHQGKQAGFEAADVPSVCDQLAAKGATGARQSGVLLAATGAFLPDYLVCKLRRKR
jgi:hypothetical protein